VLKRSRVESTGPKELVQVRELAQFGEVKARRQGGGERSPRVGEESKELRLLCLRQRRCRGGARGSGGCVRVEAYGGRGPPGR
jgi:hypothetical protein